jgi:hypothetical protein
MILSEEDKLAYAAEVEALKNKYPVANLAYRQASSALGWKYKQLELHDEDEEKINHAIILGIIDIDRPELTTELAELIMKTIQEGKIPHVKIIY